MRSLLWRILVPGLTSLFALLVGVSAGPLSPPQAELQPGVLEKIQATPAPRQTPTTDPERTAGQQILLAVDDLDGVDPGLRADTRYLDAREFPLDYRGEVYQVIAGHLHHLNLTARITPPVVVRSSVGTLLRINIRDYGWDRQTFEELALADPFYHTLVWKSYHWPQEPTDPSRYQWRGGKRYYRATNDGQYYEVGTYQKRVAALSPFLALTVKEKGALATLVSETQSQVPIVPAGWFFRQTAAQVDRRPGYYDFLGVKTKADFERLAGIDLRQRAGAELRAASRWPGPGLQPRAFTFYPDYFYSADFRQALGEKNPLLVLGAKIEQKADAFEGFLLNPSGFWWTYAADGNGLLQDRAPDFIASDSKSHSNDKRVHALSSCLRCHHEGGLKDFPDHWRELLAQPNFLSSIEPEQLKEVQSQYLRDYRPLFELARKRFGLAVKQATGFETPDEYLKAYGRLWEYTEDAHYDLPRAARALGYPQSMLKDVLAEQVGKRQGDFVMSLLLQGHDIPGRQFEEAYQPMLELIVQRLQK